MATEKRLISLDEAMEATHKEVWWTESEAAAIRSFLVKLPKVDAVEVVHGRWDAEFEYEDFQYATCSACGRRSEYMYKYCPNCGAKMGGGRKDDD